MIHKQIGLMCLMSTILLSLACSALAIDQVESVQNDAGEIIDGESLSPAETPAVDIDIQRSIRLKRDIGPDRQAGRRVRRARSDRTAVGTKGQRAAE